VVITDLGVLRPDPTSNELTLVATHPGVKVDDVQGATGWELQIASDLTVSDPPTDEELQILRDLKARTEAAHAG
jgi:glutaconate CoA-transferase subunit B